MKVETDIIPSIATSPIGQAAIPMIIYVKTDIIAFIRNVIACLTSNGLIRKNIKNMNIQQQ